MNKNYNEATALQNLLRTADAVLENYNERVAVDDDANYEHFSIIIGGKTISFILGGPQFNALLAFVQHIANENLYEVNFDEMTVSD